MNSDTEELTREGMRQFTATMRVSPDLAARTCQRHRQRTRRKLTALAAGTATVAAGAAVTATALIPARHPASHQPGAQLAARTVVKQADGNIYVTIRQFRDPAGLQTRLRADGVPASVAFTGQRNPACQPYPYRPGLLGKVVSVRLEGRHTLTIVHPSDLPNGAGLQFLSSVRHQGTVADINLDLVQASPQCTGS
jgi:hypothetical protein